MGLARDAKDFRQRIKDPAALVPNMAGINAIGFRCHFGDFNNLFGFGVRPRHINQAGGQSDCAILHRLLDHRLHRTHLLGGGRTREVAPHRLLPHRTVADQGRHVHRDIGRLQSLKKLPHLQHRRPAVAQDERGDPHADEVFRKRQLVDFLGVRMHVNKPRRHDQSSHIDLLLCLSDHFADGRDSPIFEGDVGEITRVPRAIHHPPVAQDQVKRGGAQPAATEQEPEALQK